MLATVDVNGEPGRRYSVRCKCCKARWTEDVTLQAERMGAVVIGAAHHCEKVDTWRAKHPWSVVQMSAFRTEVLCWKPKPGGRLTQCNSLCMGAKGPNCDCHCRGNNHGRGSLLTLGGDAAAPMGADVDAIA